MSPEERACGVVAYSSGNHAQGVSRAAKELGMSAIIVMPKDAPAVKVNGVKNDGAEIVIYDRLTENREQIAEDIAARDGRVVVPSYDDPFIIAGQGTTGLEIAQSGHDFDALVTCIGGGGLCAGISLAMNVLLPKTKIYAAEPEFYNDHQQSLTAGKRTPFGEAPPTLCDALMTPIPGELTWQINSKSLSGVFGVSDRDCLMAMAVAKKELGVELEPGGAVAMASVLTGKLSESLSESLSENLSGKMPQKNAKIVVILSGGNVDPAVAKRAEDMFSL